MLLLLQVRLEVLVPLDEALGVRLALADLLPAVALDALQQRREGLGTAKLTNFAKHFCKKLQIFGGLVLGSIKMNFYK